MRMAMCEDRRPFGFDASIDSTGREFVPIFLSLYYRRLGLLKEEVSLRALRALVKASDAVIDASPSNRHLPGLILL